MIRVALVAALCVWVAPPQDAPPDAPAPPTASELKKLVVEYVQASPAERPELLARIRLADSLKRSGLRSWVKRIWGQIQKGPRATKDEPHTLQVPDYGLKYTIVGAIKAGAPVCIYLHGGGSNTAANDDQWNKAQSGPGRLGFSVGVVPRAFEDTTVGWWEESAFITLAGLIDELKRTYRVDSNRIYLGGYSMGSWGTAVTGALLADRLAGCYAMAGGGHPRAPMENWRNTPYVIHVGDQDHAAGRLKTAQAQRDRLTELREADPDGYLFQYKEWEGEGHQLPGGAFTEVGAYLKDKVRDPYPKRVAWRPLHERFLYFYWLKCDRPKVGVITARIEDDNRVVVEGPKRARVTVFLNDQLVNLKKPVLVTWNGEERFNGKLDYSLSALCETLVAKEDLQQYFTARVELFDAPD